MSSPRKLVHSRGASYEITYRINDRMVRRRFPTRTAALDAMAQARTQIRAGTHLAPAEARFTLAAYARQCVTGLQVADSTSHHYQLSLRKHILPALGHVPLGSLRRSDIVAFVAVLSAKGLAPTTVESTYTVLAMVVRSATYDRLIPASPCFKIKLPPIPARGLTTFTPDQITALLAAAKPEHLPVLATAIGTGMRQGELLGLQLRCVNLLRRELSVQTQCLTPAAGGMPYLSDTLKTAASRRVIPLPRFTVDALNTHIEKYQPGPDEALFLNSRGGLWRRGAFNDSVWKPTLLRAGLPTTHGTHALRHTYASTLIAAGLHAKVIQTRLGHKSITETMDTYGHLFPDHDQETVDALDRAYIQDGLTTIDVAAEQ
jgi:integrase